MVSLVALFIFVFSTNFAQEPWYENPEWWLCIFGFPTLIVITLQTIATRRSAQATDDAVTLSRDTAEQQLRAYLSVVIGTAIYQERRPEKGDLKFECRPLLINTGQTPAKGLQFKARAGILPVPLPPGINLPDGFDEGVGESMMSPHQQANMFAVVEGFCQDSEVESIKAGSGDRGLYTWGLITYRDIFGKAHSTRFCQQVYWVGKEVRGTYIPGRNDAD